MNTSLILNTTSKNTLSLVQEEQDGSLHYIARLEDTAHLTQPLNVLLVISQGSIEHAQETNQSTQSYTPVSHGCFELLRKDSDGGLVYLVSFEDTAHGIDLYAMVVLFDSRIAHIQETPTLGALEAALF